MDGFSTKEEVISRIREIVITFKRPRAMEDLRAALKRKDTGLKLDCKQRWNSIYVMCERALTLRPELDEYIISNPEFRELFLTDEEWSAVSELCALLAPYKSASDEFSAADHPTIHLVMPYLCHLRTHIDTVAESDKVIAKSAMPIIAPNLKK